MCDLPGSSMLSSCVNTDRRGYDGCRIPRRVLGIVVDVELGHAVRSTSLWLCSLRK